MLLETKTLPDQAPQAIARNGAAGGFHRDREPDPRMREPVGFHAQREESIVDAAPAGVDRIELQLAAKSELGAKSKPTRSGLHRRPVAEGRDRF